MAGGQLSLTVTPESVIISFSSKSTWIEKANRWKRSGKVLSSKRTPIIPRNCILGERSETLQRSQRTKAMSTEANFILKEG
jgi:hypothetical protein